MRLLPRRAREGGAAAGPGLFHHSVVDFVRDLPTGARRFWVLVVAVGAVAGLGAVGLILLLDAVQRLAWPAAATFQDAVRAASPLQRVLVTTSAGVLVAIVSLVWRQPLGGHGTAGILEAIWRRSGRLSFARALVRSIVSIIAVALGASLGREGALMQTGSAAASRVARLLKLPSEEARLLVACGAAAGVAAAYNVPIGGALFGLEVLLGSFALEALGPIVVACVIATLISRALVSDHPSYDIPHYVLLRPRDLLRATLLGPVCGAFAAFWIRGIHGLASVFDRVPRRLAPVLPPIGLLIVGGLAILFPQLLGNGYDTVDDALLGVIPLTLLFALPLLKLGATALCAGVGVPGGLFTPTLFYGALLGACFGALTHRLGAAPSGAFALLGMGAMLAGTTHATVSAVLIIFELTGDYSIVLPLMLASFLSAAVSRRLEPDSLYTAALRRRNVRLPEMPRPHWLKPRTVAEIMEPATERVPPEAPMREVVLRLLSLPPGRDLYVTDERGALLGVIDLDEIAHVPVQARARLKTARDVMDTHVPTVTPRLSIFEAAERFAESDLERLPVVEELPVGRVLVGTLAKRAVLAHAAK